MCGLPYGGGMIGRRCRENIRRAAAVWVEEKRERKKREREKKKKPSFH